MRDWRWFIAVLLACVFAVTRAETRNMTENEAQVARWNQFVDALYALHQKQLEGKTIRAEERIGGYGGFPRFYREVTYYEKPTGRRLSVVQFEREHPQQIHSISVYIYGDNGNLLRDYSATYLPWGRNAPFQTLIGFYQAQDGLYAFRKFDASGKFEYEACKGALAGDDVNIDLDEFARIRAERALPGGVLASLAYQACFASLPTEAGKYLDPQ